MVFFLLWEKMTPNIIDKFIIGFFWIHHLCFYPHALIGTYLVAKYMYMSVARVYTYWYTGRSRSCILYCKNIYILWSLLVTNSNYCVQVVEALGRILTHVWEKWHQLCLIFLYFCEIKWDRCDLTLMLNSSITRRDL